MRAAPDIAILVLINELERSSLRYATVACKLLRRAVSCVQCLLIETEREKGCEKETLTDTFEMFELLTIGALLLLCSRIDTSYCCVVSGTSI